MGNSVAVEGVVNEPRLFHLGENQGELRGNRILVLIISARSAHYISHSEGFAGGPTTSNGNRDWPGDTNVTIQLFDVRAKP